jgi:hypothetical protein
VLRGPSSRRFEPANFALKVLTPAVLNLTPPSRPIQRFDADDAAHAELHVPDALSGTDSHAGRLVSRPRTLYDGAVSRVRLPPAARPCCTDLGLKSKAFENLTGNR